MSSCWTGLFLWSRKRSFVSAEETTKTRSSLETVQQKKLWWVQTDPVQADGEPRSWSNPHHVQNLQSSLWGHLVWSRFRLKSKGHLTTWIQKDQVRASMGCSSLKLETSSKRTRPEQNEQSPNLNLLENLGMLCRRLCSVIWISHLQSNMLVNDENWTE